MENKQYSGKSTGQNSAGAKFPRNVSGRAPKRNVRSKERAKSEFDQKILMIRRVARVAAGGRRFNFSVALVIGDRKGGVGVGIGKAGDTSLAIDKAVKNARKNMIKVPITKLQSIPHDVYTKYSSARVLLLPAPGKGLVAGSAVRDVLTLAGYRGVVGKVLSGSKNKLNIARATVKALVSISLKSTAPSMEPQTNSGDRSLK
ncbi:MAG: 30S ribosomal protein S5 [bacterium]|nr:30S ribosomal protein S5 [bacterium]